MAILSPVFTQDADLHDEHRTYSDRIEGWRTNREEGLKKEGGWLSVAGLH